MNKKKTCFFKLFSKKRTNQEEPECTQEKTRSEKSYDLFIKIINEIEPFKELVEKIQSSIKGDNVTFDDCIKLCFLFYLFVCEMTEYVSFETEEIPIHKRVVYNLSKMKRNKKKIREAVAARIDYIYSILDVDPHIEFLTLDNSNIVSEESLKLVQNALYEEHLGVVPIKEISNSIIRILGHV